MTLERPTVSLVPPPITRPLRGLERAQLAFGGRCYADVVIAEVEGSVELDDLVRAVGVLADRHPVLRTEIVGLSGGLTTTSVWTGAAPVGITDLPVASVVQNVLATEFGVGAPAWRVVAVPQPGRFHLVLAVHHVLVDGRSLSALLRDLLAALSGVSDLGAPLSPPPAALERGRPPAWARATLAGLRELWALRARRDQRHAALTGPRLAPEASAPTWFASRTLDAPRVAALADRARAHRATVGGALVASAHAATASFLHRRAAASGARTPIETMVDLRSSLPGAPEVGMFASGVRALSRRERGAFGWDLAARATARTDRQVAWGVPLLVHALADLDDPAAFLEARGVDLDAHGGVGATAQVSNVGRWTGPRNYGSLRLVSVGSATAAVRTGPALMVWLRTVDGVGTLTAVANGAVVSREELDAWLSDVDARLSSLEGA
jgi:hypothetical protein